VASRVGRSARGRRPTDWRTIPCLLFWSRAWQVVLNMAEVRSQRRRMVTQTPAAEYLSVEVPARPLQKRGNEKINCGLKSPVGVQSSSFNLARWCPGQVVTTANVDLKDPIRPLLRRYLLIARKERLMINNFVEQASGGSDPSAVHVPRLGRVGIQAQKCDPGWPTAECVRQSSVLQGIVSGDPWQNIILKRLHVDVLGMQCCRLSGIVASLR